MWQKALLYFPLVLGPGWWISPDRDTKSALSSEPISAFKLTLQYFSWLSSWAQCLSCYAIYIELIISIKEVSSVKHMKFQGLYSWARLPAPQLGPMEKPHCGDGPGTSLQYRHERNLIHSLFSPDWKSNCYWVLQQLGYYTHVTIKY